jgi:chromate transporter
MTNPTMKEKLSIENAAHPVPYITIFWTFFRIGLLTLGGGLAMATVMRHELVLKKRWIKDDAFMDEISTATIVPGAIAVNIAYLQGRQLRGKSGAATAIFGTVLPSFTIITLIAWFAMPYMEHPRVAAFFRGCAIAIAGQLAFAGYTFGKNLLRSVLNLVVCVAGLFVAAGLGLHPIWAVVTAAALGYVLYLRTEPPASTDQEI